MWIKNTDGKKDAMLTFATLAFLTVTVSILLGTLGDVSIAGHSIHFTTIDAGVASIYLAATFTAYVSRRWTPAAYEKKEEE